MWNPDSFSTSMRLELMYFISDCIVTVVVFKTCKTIHIDLSAVAVRSKGFYKTILNSTFPDTFSFQESKFATILTPRNKKLSKLHN